MIRTGVHVNPNPDLPVSSHLAWCGSLVCTWARKTAFTATKKRNTLKRPWFNMDKGVQWFWVYFMCSFVLMWAFSPLKNCRISLHLRCQDNYTCMKSLTSVISSRTHTRAHTQACNLATLFIAQLEHISPQSK